MEDHQAGDHDNITNVNEKRIKEEDLEELPPGFRFHPSDEELISYFLTHKFTDSSFKSRAIADVDLNKSEPWELPEKAKMGEKEWYFFSLRDLKYPTGVRTNRATNAGYWKTTGKDREIFSNITSASTSREQLSSTSITEHVGMKKTLVFYRGRAPRGEKTNWVMHEYRLNSNSPLKANKDEWVVCRVFVKSSGAGKKFPSIHPRPTGAYLHHNHHPNVINPANYMQSMLMHHHNHQQEFGSSRPSFMHADLAELQRYTRLPIHQTPLPQSLQLTFPSSNITPSGGFNLNLGAPLQQTVRPVPQPAPLIMNAAEVMTHPPTMSNCIRDRAGFSTDVAQAGARLQQMDGSVDLEGYWPQTY